MLTLLLTTLTIAAPAPAPSPKAGHYYRVAFAEKVAAGTFDPDEYTTHREPSLRWTPPRATIDYGQESVTVRLRTAKTGTVTGWEKKSDAGWVPIALAMVGPDRIATDLGGARETWVRLPYAFDELARRTRETRTAAERAKLIGRYADAKGRTITLGPKTGFVLERCLESCEMSKRAWCVVHQRVTYRWDADALTEVAPPPGLCPDGRAFEPKADAAMYTRAAK